jgi:hypothetical protein
MLHMLPMFDNMSAQCQIEAETCSNTLGTVQISYFSVLLVLPELLFCNSNVGVNHVFHGTPN